jgi:uncharacterized damage-inducible protein DinB
MSDTTQRDLEGPTDVSGLLAQQLATIYAIVELNTEGLTQEDSFAQPVPSGNCANWILAHVIAVHNALLDLLDEDPVWEHERLSVEALFEPITLPEQAFDWQTMRRRFADSRDRCVAAVSRLTPEALARPVRDPFGRPTTFAGLLGTLAVHQTYHAGQLATARRVAGRDGVVRGPGQQR